MNAFADATLKSNRGSVRYIGFGSPAHNAHTSVTIERVRVLFTETVMPRRAIAWEVGVSVASIHRWEKRFGWVRPDGKRRGRGVVLPEEVGPAPRRVSRGGKARFYPPELVAEARRLAEQTVLTRGAIARRIGVSSERIRRWRHEGGWVRPPGTTARMWEEAVATARRHCERSEAAPGPIGHGHPDTRHAEERPVRVASRSTQDGGASFETPAAQSPQDDAVGWFREILPARDESWVASPDQVRGPAGPPRHDGVGEGQPWRDALLPPGFLLPQNRRASAGKGRPYMRPVVERVRELVEGSALSQAAIAARTGVGSATVSVWMREKGWRRPLDAYRSAHEVPADRTGLSPRLAAAFARLAVLAEGEGDRGDTQRRHPEEPAQQASRRTQNGGACFETRPAKSAVADLAHPSERISGTPEMRAAPQHDAVLGGGSPPEHDAAALDRLARAARRWAFRFDREGLARLATGRRLVPGDPWEPIRISAVPKGPRHHPRGADLLAQARIAWERTHATGEAIARELGIGRTTLTRWAQMGGWIRPDGAHSPFAGRPRNPGLRHRIAQRAEAVRRLDEAERMLEGEAGLAAFEAVFGLLRDAARIVGRSPPAARR